MFSKTPLFVFDYLITRTLSQKPRLSCEAPALVGGNHLLSHQSDGES